MLRFLAVAIAALGLSPDVFAGGVRIVDATGARNFPDIQSAVNAAVDGDVLLVGAGNYPGFTLDGKGLSIFAVPAGTQGVGVSGTIEIRNVNGALSAVLVGFSVSSASLRVHDNTGQVRIQGCSFAGQSGSYPTGQDLYVAQVVDSAHVTLGQCGFHGADGHWDHFTAWHGESGMLARSSSIAAYDCVFRGGHGGNGYECPGHGGTGLRAESSRIFAAASSFGGGGGGVGTADAYGYVCGDGGAGLELASDSLARVLDVTCAGGVAGYGAYDCSDGNCSNGSAIAGPVEQLPGAARTFLLPAVTTDRSPWSVSIHAVARDAVFLNRSLAPVFEYEPALSGVCTSLLPPFPAVAPLGSVPAAGDLALGLPPRPLPASVVARLYFLQGYVTNPAGATFLGSPLLTLSLNWDSLPDCNGNGINDYAEVIAGVAADANHDVIPDDCP